MELLKCQLCNSDCWYSHCQQCEKAKLKLAQNRATGSTSGPPYMLGNAVRWAIYHCSNARMSFFHMGEKLWDCLPPPTDRKWSDSPVFAKLKIKNQNEYEVWILIGVQFIAELLERSNCALKENSLQFLLSLWYGGLNRMSSSSSADFITSY